MISPEFKFQLTDIIQPTFKEGIIVSQYKLNYDEVSSWLREKDIPLNVNENLFYALSLIYNIARKIRRARLPESYFVHSVNECYNDMKIESNFEAHVLIEEFMLLANEYVARKIYEVYPDFSLLRMQNAVENFEEWKENLFKQTNMNFAGQLKEYCSLLNIRVSNFETKKKLLVSKKFLVKFNELLKYDAEKARNLLQYDTYYNDFYVHITEWYEINHPARYDCSIKGCITNGHFSLNKSLYTHFTSPIRRFADIVVHRLLKSVIKGIRIDDDVTLDIPHVCTIANKKLSGNRTFEKICAPYAIFDETDKMFCFILDCACSEINNEELRFAHPLLQKSSSRKEINFADLSLDSVPLSLKINEKVESCILKWRKIIFSCPPIDYSNSSTNKFVIDNNVFDAYLLDSSYKLFQEIRRSYLPTEKLAGKLNELKSAFIIPNYDNVISSDSISISNPIIEIEIKIFIKNTLRIQFCKYKVNGLPKISPELYIVAPTFQICLIHYDDPVRFFISGGKLKLKHNDIKKVFDSIREYQEYFEPLILIESLEETLADSSAFTLLSVPILWVVGPSSVSNCKDRYGVIILPQEFCKIRNIIFNDEKEEIIDRYEYLIEKGFSSVGGDLLCLRYKLESWKNFWVGHGEVVYVGKYRNEENNICKVIIFRLTQSDYDSFSNNSENGKYTIDVYLKSVVSKRQQEAISSINNHPLLKEVILGRQELSVQNNDDFINSLKNDIQNKNLFKFNRNQTKAMFNAMNQKLSLIWGPPGTGKTHIGCILSYGFTQKNHDKKNGGVVLYCGPSNDCVNLVASEMQKKFSDLCPKLLRIFGEQQELADFPLPGVKSKNNVKLTGEISEISLHYLIRKSGAKYADALRKYDDHFAKINNQERHYNNSDNNLETLHSTIVAYRDTVKDAKKQWIKDNRYDMVICTTSVTASSVMELFNITQVIIDEAGMCKEPETLIPISRVEETVQNVVLIGDHKQLRPIIHSKVANKRGLQISLFERYQELKPELVTMLNIQYRMHPSICEFPSKEFYSGRLRTQISNLWAGLSQEEMKFGQSYFQWNGIDYKRYCKGYYRSVLKQSNYDAIPNENWPGVRTDRFKCFQAEFDWYPERIIFFHVVGDEITQSVTTSTGNENSRGNNQEVEAVGCIYRKLIKRLHPPRQAPNFVTVLTQYKLQQHLIQSKCQEILSSENIRRVAPQVKTVIRSQGSENDYIIFSTVRSLRNKEDINENPTPGWEKQYLGFITDPNQVNVALTRAKKGLIIIGNKELLRVNKIWKRLIIDLERRNCVVENYLDFLP